jgi:hypothetical protein
VEDRPILGRPGEGGPAPRQVQGVEAGPVPADQDAGGRRPPDRVLLHAGRPPAARVPAVVPRRPGEEGAVRVVRAQGRGPRRQLGRGVEAGGDQGRLRPVDRAPPEPDRLRAGHARRAGGHRRPEVRHPEGRPGRGRPRRLADGRPRQPEGRGGGLGDDQRPAGRQLEGDLGVRDREGDRLPAADRGGGQGGQGRDQAAADPQLPGGGVRADHPGGVGCPGDGLQATDRSRRTKSTSPTASAR